MKLSFQQALLSHLDAHGESLRSIALATGVSYEQLKKVKQRGGSTNLEDAVRVANFFGKTIEEFLGDASARERLEILDLYNQLGKQEQDHLLATARAFAASRPKPE